ncbi:clumping factor A-like [Ptychodera flava]|uniref:clumping factor A-like n=1 Tax=Ptychodera flava TaxID=63121 RepID=UPI00396A7392
MTSSANISFTISTSIRVAFEEGSKDGQHLKPRSIQSSCNDEFESRMGCEKSSALDELKQVGQHCGRTMPSNPRNREPVTLSTKDCCQVWEEVKKTNKIDVFGESFMTTTQELLGHLKSDSLTEKEKATIINFMCDSGVIDIHTTTRVFSDDKNSTENTGPERTRISVSPEENDPSNNTGSIAANITEGNEISSEPFHMEYTHGNISDELDECEIREISVKVEKEEGSASLTDQEFFEAVSMVKDESEQGKREEDDHGICAPQDSSNSDTRQIGSLGPEISDPDYVNSVPPPSLTAVREVLETYTSDGGTDSVTLKIEDKIRKDRKGTQRYGIPGEQEHSLDRSCSENDKHSAYYVCDSTESTERNHGDKIQQENVLKSLDVGFQGGDPKPGDGGTAENIWVCITDERLHDTGNVQLMIPAEEIPDPGIKWSATSHNKDNAAANIDGSDMLTQVDTDQIDIQSSIVSSIRSQSLFSHKENSNHLRNGPSVPEEGSPSDTDTADDIILDKETDDEQFVVTNKRLKKIDSCHNDDGNDADDDEEDDDDEGDDGGVVAAGDDDAGEVDNHGDAIAANTADADGDKTESRPEVTEMSTSINMEKKRTAEFIPGEGASKTAQFKNDEVTNENIVKSRFSEQGQQENQSDTSGGNDVCDTNDDDDDEDTDDEGDTDVEGEEIDENYEEEEEEECDNSDDSDYDVLADLAGSYDSDFDSNGDYIGYHKRFYEIVNQTKADFVNIKHSDTQDQFNKKQCIGTDNVSSHSLSHDISDTLSRTDKGKLNSKCSNTDVISEDNSKIADLVSRDQSQSIGHLNSDGMSVGNNEINAIANKKQ